MKRIFSKVSLLLVNLSLKLKIRLIILLLMLLPLACFTFISFIMTRQLVMNQSLASMTASFENSLAVLDRCFESTKLAIDNLVVNEDIYRLPSESNNSTLAISQQQWYQRISSFFSYIEMCTGVDNIHLYLSGKTMLAEKEQTFSSFQRIENCDWYMGMRAKKQNRSFLNPMDRFFDDRDETSFSYVSILYSPDAFMVPIGLIRTEVYTDRIHDILCGLSTTANTLVYLSQNQKILLANQDESNGFYPDFQDQTLSVQNIKKLDSSYFTEGYIGSEKFITYSCQVGTSPFVLSLFVPSSELFEHQNTLYRFLFLGIVLISIAAFFLADISVSYIIKRIYFLNSETEKVKAGQFDIQIEVTGKDEIGQLVENFQSMTARIQEMINEKYEMGRAIKNAEFSALQAQINPHFLYNSLDLINCTALQQGVPQISDIIDALVSYYKISLSNGEDIITISQELKHASLYIDIQNLRFDKKTVLICDEPDWFSQYLIPKITFQPLIENAILHGILESDVESGEIHIEAKKNQSTLLLLIRDNGIGMSQKQLYELQNSSPKKKGYGIKNVDERIKLLFGAEYGLTFSSIPGCGTTVTIRLPVITQHLRLND